MATQTLEYILPDLPALCPWTSTVNPHHNSVAKESATWIQGFTAVSDRKQAYFTSMSPELFVMYAFPFADYERIRTCSDFMNVLFIVEDLTDNSDGDGARELAITYLQALNGEVGNNSPLYRMTSEFRTKFAAQASPGCLRRFLMRNDEYINGIAREAALREKDVILSTEEYKKLRRKNCGVHTAFGLNEYVLGVDLPDEVFDNEHFKQVYDLALDLMWLCNDIYSYSMEIVEGLYGNNIITILMKNDGLTLQQAFDEAGSIFRSFLDDFLFVKGKFPSFGAKVDAEVEAYMACLEKWIIGNINWSRESVRYFGPEHEEVKRSRIVRLNPGVEMNWSA